MVGNYTYLTEWVRKIRWRRKWQSTPVLLPGKSHEQKSLVGYSPRRHKELDTTEQLHLMLLASFLRLPWWFSGKESACDERLMFDPSFGKILWRWKWQLSQVFFPGKSHGQRSMGWRGGATVHGVAKDLDIA